MFIRPTTSATTSPRSPASEIGVRDVARRAASTRSPASSRRSTVLAASRALCAARNTCIRGGARHEYGRVYRATLATGETVAVKMFDNGSSSGQSEAEFCEQVTHEKPFPHLRLAE